MREGFAKARFALIRPHNPYTSYADRFGHRGEAGIIEADSIVEETGALLLELDESERAVIENDHLDRQLQLTEAEDVSQEAFITAFQKLATFRGEAAFKTWLLAIT